MKLKEVIKVIEKFYNIKLKTNYCYMDEAYHVYAKDVPWIDFNGKSGSGRKIITLNKPHRGEEQLFFLMPSDELSESAITFITTSRKRNMWTDEYSNCYARWDEYDIEKLKDEEEIIGILQRQKEAYQLMNGMHKDEEMKETLDRMKEIQKDIREKQKVLNTMKQKLCKVYNRKLKILTE